MPVLPVSQQSDWNNNVYVLVTTRIFVMIGMAYLIKILYNLVPSTWSPRFTSAAAVVSDAVGLEDITSDIPVTVPGAIGAGPDLEANLTGFDLEATLTGPDFEASLTGPDLEATLPGPDLEATLPGPDLETNLTLDIRPPQPSYDPQSHAERSRAQHQGIEVSGSPTAAHAIQEQDIGVRGGDTHTE